MTRGGPLEAGDTIAGRFRLERPLGAGGMGEVWIARQLALERDVALKLIKPEVLAASDGASDVIERFQTEARALARVQHPHVVQVIDAGADDDGRLFLVMELLEGETLRARLARGPLPLEDALRVAREITSALVASHGAGILHRDLKAENVFLALAAGAPERAKVLDFGLSRLAQQQDRSLTPTGVIVGTPGYIAPEQLLGDHVDARADLYALGVMLFEMLAGAPPFSGQTAVELLMQHASVPAPRVAVYAERRGRVVPGALDALVASLLAKSARDRPADANALLAALDPTRAAGTRPAGTAAYDGGDAPGTPQPAATETLSAPRALESRPLLGRERELASLVASLDGATQGRGALAFLVGEPGIGKTRLCDAFSTECARRGVPVLVGRAWEAGGAPAFHPWSEALETLVDSLPDPLSPDEAAVLSEVVPSLRAHAERDVKLEANDARFRLFAAVGALLKRASARHPIAIILDDLHAADAASLQLLLAIARDLPRRKLVFVCTYRDVEAELNDEVKELLGRAAREARTLHLTRLPEADVETLVRTQAGHVVDARVCAAIFKATQGNPLFVDEMVRLLSSQGRLEALGDAPLPVPLGVREAIRQRLSRAAGATRAALEVIAVLGREAKTATAAAVHGGPVEDAVREGIRFGVLARAEKGAVRFSHALFREELLDALAETRAHELHASAAAALKVSVDPPLHEIAGHLLDAGPERAIAAADASLAAAEELVAALAFEDAAALVGRVLENATLIDDARRADCLILLGRAVMLAGDVARAHELCLRAAEIARARGDFELLARAALGYGARITEAFVDPRLVGLLREAASGLTDKPGWRARVLGRLAAALQPTADPHVPIAIADEAFALARAHLDERERLAVLHDGMGAWMSIVAPARRRRVNEELLALAERFHDAPRRLRARFRLVLDGVEGGAPDVEQLLTAYRDDAARVSSRDALWRAAMLVAMVRSLQGDEVASDRALEEAESFGASSTFIASHRYLRACLWHRGSTDLTGARAWQAQLEGYAGDAGVAVLEAREHAARGDREAAARAIERARPRIEGDHFLTRYGMSAIAFAGDAAWCARLYVELEHDEHLFGIETNGLSAIDQLDQVRARLAEGCGRIDDARRCIGAAIDRTRALGYRAVLPTLLIDGARIWARGARPDLTRADALLEEGRARAAELRQPELDLWLRGAADAIAAARA